MSVEWVWMADAESQHGVVRVKCSEPGGNQATHNHIRSYTTVQFAVSLSAACLFIGFDRLDSTVFVHWL